MTFDTTSHTIDAIHNQASSTSSHSDHTSGYPPSYQSLAMPSSSTWYCHACEATFPSPIREGADDLPLCPSCMSDVVEEQEAPPSQSQEEENDDRGWFNPPPMGRPQDPMAGFMGALLGGGSGSGSQRTRSNPGQPSIRTFQWGPIQGSIMTGPSAAMGSGGWRFGGPSILGVGPDGRVRDPFNNHQHEPHAEDESPQVIPLEEMLAQLMAHLQAPSANGGLPPWAMMGMPGDPGDYVHSQEGMDAIMERLMEAAAQQNGPPPASDIVIEGLPRLKLDQEALDASQYKDCNICLTSFELGEEVVRIPCKHIFHSTCLVPWLKQNGTCPVCRFSLVSEEDQRRQGDSRQEGAAQPTNPLGAIYNGIANMFASVRGGGGQQESGGGGGGDSVPGAFPGTAYQQGTTAGPLASSATRDASDNLHLRPATESGTTSTSASAVASGNVDTHEPTAAGTSGIHDPIPPPSASAAPTTTASGVTEPPTIAPYPSAIPPEVRQMHARREAEQRAREQQQQQEHHLE